MNELAANILNSMPGETRFNQKDADVLKKHSALLLELEDVVVSGFYDSLFAHPAANAILTKEGTREDREKALRTWWKRTLTSEINESYWGWQAFVGLVHVKQKVSNSLIIGMWGWILNTLSTTLKDRLTPDELSELMSSFTRLAATIQSLIAESYLENYLQAIRQATGFKQELIDRIVGTQIDGMLKASVKN